MSDRPASVHRTLVWTNERERWGWHCRDCPATARGYSSQMAAERVAAIHEDPSRAGLKQTTTN